MESSFREREVVDRVIASPSDGRGVFSSMTESLQEGLVLDDRYRLLRPLSAGGMGSVWVAEQRRLQREVAVKLLLDSPGAEDRARLRQEALSLAAVRHPAIVEIYDYGETATGAPYVVMELVQGEPLSARILREGAYDARAAVGLMLPLLEGLEAAHQAGVIHRDIKPTNVLVAASPNRPPHLKLLDFGIARLERSGAPRVTRVGSVMGTPENMAPEQVRGLATDARTDVWGAGVLLYEMIAGQNPFYADDMFVTMRRVADAMPPYPLRASGVDGQLWRLLTGSLRKAPEDRPPSAAAFREELQDWLSKSAAPSVAERADVATLPAPRPAPISADAPTLASRGREANATEPASIDALIREKLRNS